MASPHLTVVARVARGTGAAVTAQPIDAGATVLTRFGVTLIDVELAIGTSEARLAMANVRVDAVDTGTIVEARAINTKISGEDDIWYARLCRSGIEYKSWEV